MAIGIEERSLLGFIGEKQLWRGNQRWGSSRNGLK